MEVAIAWCNNAEPALKEVHVGAQQGEPVNFQIDKGHIGHLLYLWCKSVPVYNSNGGGDFHLLSSNRTDVSSHLILLIPKALL